jgi:hopanoid-associated phosphorylase
VVAAVGLAFEARIAAGPGVVVLGRSGGRVGLVASVEQAIRHGCRGIISFGIAGGLDARLRPGAWVIGSDIIDTSGERWPTCPNWSAKILQALPGAIHAPIAGSDGPVAHPAVKRLLHKKTGAAVVDMESHIAARLAARHGVAFVALRVVCDPAHRALPSAALAGMREDGTTDALGVIRGLASRPSSLPGVLRTAVDAAAARATLQRSRQILGASFGFLEEAAGMSQPDALPALADALPALPSAESQPA